MIAETIHVEEEIEAGMSAAPWDRALSTKGILDSESDSSLSLSSWMSSWILLVQS